MSLSTPQVTSSSPPLTTTYFGIDFAKDTFTFKGLLLGGTLPNDPAGHRRLLAKLPPGAHLVCESTGYYHRALVRAAQADGVAVTVANPRQVRDFAKGLGRRAKTDPIDAQSLLDFGTLVQPAADLPPTPAQALLQELVVTRQQAVLERSSLTLQLASQVAKLPRALTQARITLLSAHVKKLEVAMAKTLATEEALAGQAARLTQVDGVGVLTAVTCLALCPELGTLSRTESAALLGVAPFNEDSGNLSSPRHIAGGRLRLRNAVYMAALSATRSNHVLRAFYRKLRAANKPAKLALTAVMRKLFILLNHLLKHPEFQLTTPPLKTA
jgi:transposase